MANILCRSMTLWRLNSLNGTCGIVLGIYKHILKYTILLLPITNWKLGGKFCLPVAELSLKVPESSPRTLAIGSITPVKIDEWIRTLKPAERQVLSNALNKYHLNETSRYLYLTNLQPLH